MNDGDFNAMFGDFDANKVEMEESTKMLAGLYKALRGHGLSVLEAATLVVVLVQIPASLASYPIQTKDTEDE